MFCASARFAVTDVMLLLISLKLRFIFSIPKIHRLSRARTLVLSALASHLKDELSVERDVHGFFEMQRAYMEYFRPGDPSTEPFH